MNVEHRRALRTRLRRQRADLHANERVKAATALADHLADLPEILTDQRVAGYWASDGELPLAAVVPHLLARGQTFLLPVLPAQRRGAMHFAPWRTGAPVQANYFGIPEPVVGKEPLVAADALELVLVPLVGFDRRGHRLGMGGGYYDATFAFLNQGTRPREPLLVGIAYAFQEVPELEPAGHDVHLDFVCTERELIECMRAS